MIPYIEPYKIKMVEKIHMSNREEREQWIRQARFNLFNLKSNQVIIDLLTDSGTGAMSDEQWAALLTGDESYAGSSSFEHLRDTVEDITGFPWFLPTHQGRAAENVLFSTLVKEGNIIPGNAHFDTTKGHIEFRHAEALDCTVREAYDTDLELPFKGNLDLEKLENLLAGPKGEQVPFILVTITCNTVGGQPVSMENLRAVRKLADTYGKAVYFDAARFAENAFFIREREKVYRQRSMQEIILEMFSYADGMTMSSKKDGLVNIGGFIALRHEEVYRACSQFNIMFEGFNTYGGMSGRDMNALARGLREGTDEEYLASRIKQVARLGNSLQEAGVPIQKPVGGHAVFVHANRFYPNIPREEFPAQTLAVELYREAGVRAVEIGTLLADRDPVSRENRYPAAEFVRLAIPRRVYTDHHMDYVADALVRLYAAGQQLRHGYRITWEAPLMRHFTVELEPVKA